MPDPLALITGVKPPQCGRITFIAHNILTIDLEIHKDGSFFQMISISCYDIFYGRIFIMDTQEKFADSPVKIFRIIRV